MRAEVVASGAGRDDEEVQARLGEREVVRERVERVAAPTTSAGDVDAACPSRARLAIADCGLRIADWIADWRRTVTAESA